MGTASIHSPSDSPSYLLWPPSAEISELLKVYEGDRKNLPCNMCMTGPNLVAGEGFEPSKAEPGDLQSPPIGRSGNPPGS